MIKCSFLFKNTFIRNIQYSLIFSNQLARRKSSIIRWGHQRNNHLYIAAVVVAVDCIVAHVVVVVEVDIGEEWEEDDQKL